MGFCLRTKHTLHIGWLLLWCLCSWEASILCLELYIGRTQYIDGWSVDWWWFCASILAISYNLSFWRVIHYVVSDHPWCSSSLWWSWEQSHASLSIQRESHSSKACITGSCSAAFWLMASSSSLSMMWSRGLINFVQVQVQILEIRLHALLGLQVSSWEPHTFVILAYISHWCYTSVLLTEISLRYW